MLMWQLVSEARFTKTIIILPTTSPQSLAGVPRLLLGLLTATSSSVKHTEVLRDQVNLLVLSFYSVSELRY